MAHRPFQVFFVFGGKAKAAGKNLRLCNKKRGEENEKEKNQIIKLSIYIITSICEKYKWLNFKIL